MYARVSQNSGHFLFRYSFGSMIRRTGTPDWCFERSACVMLLTFSR